MKLFPYRKGIITDNTCVVRRKMNKMHTLRSFSCQNLLWKYLFTIFRSVDLQECIWRWWCNQADTGHALKSTKMHARKRMNKFIIRHHKIFLRLASDLSPEVVSSPCLHQDLVISSSLSLHADVDLLHLCIFLHHPTCPAKELIKRPFLKICQNKWRHKLNSTTFQVWFFWFCAWIYF